VRGLAVSLPGGIAYVVAICNLKGGTGKSTLSINLACAFAELGGDVAILDNDEQGSATAWAAAGKLPVRCVHLPLSAGEDPGEWIRQLQSLRIGRRVVVVDFPATVAPALAGTLLLASVVLIPCAPNRLEVAATRRMMRYVTRLRAERRDDPPAILVVPNRVGGPGTGLEEFRAELAVLGEELSPAISARPEYARAFAQGRWIGDSFPGSEAHREILELANLVCDRFESPPTPAPIRQSRPRTFFPMAWAAHLVTSLGQQMRHGASP
jgi:chromosome partitioning protein